MRLLHTMILAALALLILGSAGAASAAEIAITTPAGPVPAGESLVLPVTVTGADRFDACDISISADPSDVIISANTTCPPEGGMLSVNTQENTAKFSFCHLTGITGDATLCYLDCTPQKSGSSLPLNLRLESIAENGSAGTPGDEISERYSVVSGVITTRNAPPEVRRIVIRPESVQTLCTGEKQQFSAKIYDQYESLIKAPLRWVSSDPETGSIDAGTGLFTALHGGSTDITATSGKVISEPLRVSIYLTPISVPQAPEKPVSPVINSENTSPLLKVVVDQKDLNGTLSDAGFSVRDLDPLNTGIPEFAAGMGRPDEAFMLLEITPENISTLRHSALLSLSIPATELPEKRRYDVRAYRYSALTGAWEALPTTWTGTETGMHHYEVKAPDFSLFAMVQTRGGATPPPEPVPTKKPGHSSSGGGGGHRTVQPMPVSTEVISVNATPAAGNTSSLNVIPTQAPEATVTMQRSAPAEAESNATATATATTAQSPGFGILAALAGAGAGALFRRRT